MKTIASWMTLDEVEGAKTRGYFIYSSSTKDMNTFIYQHPFGLDFEYIHQVDDQNNPRHAKISLERTWTTNLWKNCNFAWYLAVSEVNTGLVSGNFKNDGVV